MVIFEGVKKEKEAPTEIFMTIKPFLGNSLLQGEQCASLILQLNANVTVSQRSVCVKSKYKEAFAI